MALSIGATASVYSIHYGVLIDPYPYRDADYIASILIQSKLGRFELPLTMAETDQLRRFKSVEMAIRFIHIYPMGCSVVSARAPPIAAW